MRKEEPVMRIIYFDIDCLRPDHLGCYGYGRPTSPTIDGIAAQGMRFDRYYCGSSPCLPSRTAWASGRFGIRNGVISNHGAGAQFHLRTRRYGGPELENDMLTRHLRRYGYDTYSFSNFADRHNALWFMYGWTAFHTPNLKGGAETAEEVNAPLLKWLEHNASRENYFLHVNYWDAHRPYKMAASWADRFIGKPIIQEWPEKAVIERHETLEGPFTAHGQFPDDESPYTLMPGAITSRLDWEKMINGYDSAIAYVDHHLRLVLNELERQDVLDDTAIIISADHGDAFGEHGIYSDHVCADECIHHIPLIIRWPGVVPEGEHASPLLYNVDLAPTLCDLLDIPVPADWDGTSFRPWLQGDLGPGRDYLVWDHGLYTVQRAVRTDRHLMILTYDDDGYSQFPPLALYDLERDPFQTRNLAASEPDIVAQCSAYLTEWLAAQKRKPHWRGDPLDAILQERALEGKSLT
jgi:arylsulfatase A-like enzyme